MKGMRFHAFHGVYDFEKRDGAPFEVNISIQYEPLNYPLPDLSAALNYVEVYDWIKKMMAKPEALLENIVKKMGDGILENFPQALSAEVSIVKLQPPIEGFNGTIGLRYEAIRI